MVRINTYLTQKQLNSLSGLAEDGPMAEHIRIAIDEYLKRKEKLQVSLSPSHGTKPKP